MAAADNVAVHRYGRDLGIRVLPVYERQAAGSLNDSAGQTMLYADLVDAG